MIKIMIISIVPPPVNEAGQGSATVPPHPTATLCSGWIRAFTHSVLILFMAYVINTGLSAQRYRSTDGQLFMGNFCRCVIEDRSNTHVHKYNSVTPHLILRSTPSHHQCMPFSSAFLPQSPSSHHSLPIAIRCCCAVIRLHSAIRRRRRSMQMPSIITKGASKREEKGPVFRISQSKLRGSLKVGFAFIRHPPWDHYKLSTYWARN